MVKYSTSFLALQAFHSLIDSAWLLSIHVAFDTVTSVQADKTTGSKLLPITVADAWHS